MTTSDACIFSTPHKHTAQGNNCNLQLHSYTNLVVIGINDVVVGLTVEKEVNLVDLVDAVCPVKLCELDDETLETNKRFV